MSTIKIRNICFALLMVVISSLVWVPAHAEEMSCPEHAPVVIDIRPGEDPNSVNLSSKGLLPVAVVTTSDFDASLFEPEMAHLSDANAPMSEGCSGATPVRWTLDDVNRDGNVDLVFFFRVQELDLSLNSTAAILMAHGSYGGVMLHILGADTVKIVPK